jgi:hypothetical protein
MREIQIELSFIWYMCKEGKKQKVAFKYDIQSKLEHRKSKSYIMNDKTTSKKYFFFIVLLSYRCTGLYLNIHGEYSYSTFKFLRLK